MTNIADAVKAFRDAVKAMDAIAGGINERINGDCKMQRGTKEFYEIQKSFEKAAKSGVFGYVPSDFTKDDFNSSTFYANGEVNRVFLAYMAGYAAAKCEYQ